MVRFGQMSWLCLDWMLVWSSGKKSDSDDELECGNRASHRAGSIAIDRQLASLSQQQKRKHWTVQLLQRPRCVVKLVLVSICDDRESEFECTICVAFEVA